MAAGLRVAGSAAFFVRPPPRVPRDIARADPLRIPARWHPRLRSGAPDRSPAAAPPTPRRRSRPGAQAKPSMRPTAAASRRGPGLAAPPPERRARQLFDPGAARAEERLVQERHRQPIGRAPFWSGRARSASPRRAKQWPQGAGPSGAIAPPRERVCSGAQPSRSTP
jgi:hypothetical protein